MKKLYTFVISLGIAQLSALAVPADPEPRQVLNPDGSTLTVQILGDEHRNMLVTSDNIPLYYNASSGTLEYATLRDGATAGSGIQARDPRFRSEQELAALKQIDTEQVRKVMAAAATDRMQVAKRSDYLISDYPTLGKQKTLVVLVEFSDVRFSGMEQPLQFYTDMLNKEGFTYANGANGSARDYYLACSAGQFDPQFEVVGPVRLSREATYYGSDDPKQDCRMGEFLTEALNQIDPDVDFSQYDLDNNGYIDNIFFFYAGHGQADSPQTDLIWPHSAEAPVAWELNLELDGKLFSHYACSNELRYSTVGNIDIAGIGTFVHEFGHVLGLVDLYDVSYGFLTHHPNKWDVMASGAYNNNMHTPPLFSAFERAELAWLDYEKLPADYAAILEVERLDKSNKGWRIDVPGNSEEYYVIENRQQEGWDFHLPGHGMLVWHIDQDAEAWKKNIVNIDPSHQRVDVIEADNAADTSTFSGDPFPGSKGVTQFDLYAWDYSKLVSFDDVTERDGSIFLLLAGTEFEMPAPEAIAADSVEEDRFTFSWTPVENAKFYIVDVKDAETGAAVGSFSEKRYFSAEAVNVGGLVPDHTYAVTVKAGLGSYVSKGTESEIRTTEIPFAKLYVTGLGAEEVSESGFTAVWDELEGADSYNLYLSKHQYSSETEDSGYDFADKYDGLPVLWSTNSSMYYSVSGYYGKAAPSLRLSSDGDYLVVAWPEALIANLKFWCRAKEAGQKLHVQVEDPDNGWADVQVIEVGTEGKTESVSLDNVAKARLVYERTAGFVAIDDVVTSCCKLVRTPVSGYYPANAATGCSHAFTGLEGGCTYGYTVVALSGDDASANSQEFTLTLPGTSGVSAIVPEMNSAVIFDLMGRRYSDISRLERGIYIINGKKQTVK